MEGLVFLMIIYWIIKSISKSKQKKQSSSASKNGSSAGQRQTKAQQELDAVRKKRLAELAAQKVRQQAMSFDSPSSPGEGEGMNASVFRGSLNVESTEGEDLCDPSLGHDRDSLLTTGSVYANEIGRDPALDFSAKGILQGVVMSEILSRPTQRRR